MPFKLKKTFGFQKIVVKVMMSIVTNKAPMLYITVRVKIFKMIASENKLNWKLK